MPSTIVVKIGGSTLGSHDTTLDDIAALWAAGQRIIVVHGGGPEITRWLAIHEVESRFVNGLRVTDAPALDIVVAVLAGVINKQLVAQFTRLGVRAAGISGADAGLVDAFVEDPAYGFVGAVRGVEPALLTSLLDARILPVVAPVAMDVASAQLLNVNGDTVAGEIAAALPGSRLVFLTDVPGVLDADGRLVGRLSPRLSGELRAAGVLKGGMLPKIDACLRAARFGGTPVITDGRVPRALSIAVGAQPAGTVVG